MGGEEGDIKFLPETLNFLTHSPVTFRAFEMMWLKLILLRKCPKLHGGQKIMSMFTSISLPFCEVEEDTTSSGLFSSLFKACHHSDPFSESDPQYRALF